MCDRYMFGQNQIKQIHTQKQKNVGKYLILSRPLDPLIKLFAGGLSLPHESDAA